MGPISTNKEKKDLMVITNTDTTNKDGSNNFPILKNNLNTITDSLAGSVIPILTIIVIALIVILISCFTLSTGINWMYGVKDKAVLVGLSIMILCAFCAAGIMFFGVAKIPWAIGNAIAELMKNYQSQSKEQTIGDVAIIAFSTIALLVVSTASFGIIGNGVNYITSSPIGSNLFATIPTEENISTGIVDSIELAGRGRFRGYNPVTTTASAAIMSSPSSNWSNVIHTVSSGENVEKIAKRYAVTPLSIQETNKMKAPYTIRTGQKLQIPTKTK